MTGQLPDWPALMDEDLASAYCSLCPKTFRTLTALRKVAPVELSLRVTRWRRRDLDAFIDTLPRRGVEITPEAANAPDPAQAALEAARRRVRRER